MIFASLGTMDMPFVRMARAVEILAAGTEEEVIVQTGWTSYEYKYAKAFKFCTKDEMQQYIDRASLLIMQGGWGAISEAMEKRKRMVIIPRHDQTEHIHDQFQLIRKLDELGCVVGCFDEKELPACIEKARSFKFEQLDKGNAEILIREKLNEWMK
ncbi:glycosyltransferase [Xylanibacter caecicola]|uniref:glycosyltransferase n=1 Tax=Xylanibacter caecicola TaxID=2736294 RepID=UPI00258B1616|nr:glycosyltransferase [Xylanibacter caecicola]